MLSARTGLLARPADPASLTRAIAYMLDHPDEAACMAEAARAHIGQQFRPDRLGADLMHVYDTALRLAAPRVARSR